MYINEHSFYIIELELHLFSTTFTNIQCTIDACYYSSITIAEIQAGASANKCTSTGVSALSMMCLYNQPELTQKLLQQRAYPKQRDDVGSTPLHCAAWAGSERCVKVLLSSRVQLVGAKDQDGRTPLHYAAVQVSHCQPLVLFVL